MGYKGVVKGNVIVLENGVNLPEGTEVEVTTKGWWMSEEAKRNATDKESFRRLLDKCAELRKQMPKALPPSDPLHRDRRYDREKKAQSVDDGYRGG